MVIPTKDGINFLQNDIESIVVLKDASSAAIYGSRAANGAAPIAKPKPTWASSLNYSGMAVFKRMAILPKMATAEYVVELYNEVADNDTMPVLRILHWSGLKFCNQ